MKKALKNKRSQCATLAEHHSSAVTPLPYAGMTRIRFKGLSRRIGTLSFSTPPGLNYFPTSKNGRETVAMCLQNKLAAGQGLRQCLTWIIAAGSVVDAGSRNLDGFACRLMLSPAAGYG
jgi:hypothetical protein